MHALATSDALANEVRGEQDTIRRMSSLFSVATAGRFCGSFGLAQRVPGSRLGRVENGNEVLHDG
jgi:hypothetical protein